MTIIKNKKGFTLIEILVVIGLMATLSVLFIVSIRSTEKQRFDRTVDNLATDLQYIRNLALSRSQYNGSYPGGYGIKLNNGNGTTEASSYILYAGDFNQVIKSVTFSDVSFRIGDYNASSTIADPNWTGSIEFVDERSADIYNLQTDLAQQYSLFLQYSVTNGNMRSIILVGEESDDGFVWANIGYNTGFASYQCGDGVQDPSEDCDDGNEDQTDECRYCETYSNGGGGRFDPISGEGEGGGFIQ